jgi:uncharacterized protein (TIGR04222 family)
MAAGDTWGISGPNFLALYAAAAVAVGAYAIWARRRADGDAVASGRTPQPAELAFLNGGSTTAVYSSLAGLRAAQAVEVGPLGELSVSGDLPPGASRLDHAVHDAARRHVQARLLPADPGVSNALREILDGLGRAGWVRDDAQRAKARLGGWVMLALAGLGGVRVLAGMANDRPVGFLVALVAVTIPIALVLLVVRRHSPTAAGRRALMDARRSHQHLQPSQAPAWSTYGFTGAAMGVALFGTGALWAADPEFARHAGVLRTPTSSGSSSSDGGGGGGSDGGGGGSCGGGGCGGGGCGG